MQESRFTIDPAGNILLPMNWQGIMVPTSSAPVPRLLRATFKSLVPFAIPSQSSLTSWTPEGGKLPPIFVPQTDPAAAAAPGTIALFGSADAPSTVLRIANRRGRCAGGTKDYQWCATDSDCPGDGACDTICGGGTNDGGFCATDAECPDGAALR